MQLLTGFVPYVCADDQDRRGQVAAYFDHERAAIILTEANPGAGGLVKLISHQLGASNSEIDRTVEIVGEYSAV